jgi:hypothetical protein
VKLAISDFWKITSRHGPPLTEGPKLYIYRPAATPRVALYRGRSWWDDDGERELGAPYCWANLEDLPRPPGER